MIAWFERTLNHITEYWNTRKYWHAILLVVSYILVIAVLFFIGYKVLSFVIINWESIVTIVFFYALLFFLIKEHYAEKRGAREQKKKEQQAIQESIDKKALEENYTVVRKIIYASLKNTSDLLSIKLPVNEQDLDSPNHCLSQGKFYLYQYVVFKKATILENDLIKSVLQEEINRLLSNGYVSGLGNQTVYLFEGKAYNYIDVYSITDNAGYITLSVAIASEDYYRFKTAQGNSRLFIKPNLSQQHDKDF